jgi:signal transduction histidine kinase
MSVFWNRRAPRIAPGNLEVERRNGDLRAVNAYRVQVSDSGPGVPVENLEKIFEEYTSYAGSQDRSGGGLGLAICKMIMKAHQGQMFAESSGTGATFAFVLPYPGGEQCPGLGIPDSEATALSG